MGRIDRGTSLTPVRPDLIPSAPRNPHPSCAMLLSMDDGRALPDSIGDPADADHLTDDAARDALALYALLTPGARRALRSLFALAQTEEQVALGQAVGHLVMQHGFDIARRCMADAVRQAYPGEWPATEEEIAEEAVRLVREARARLAQP